jgi:steroid Delta-isomerase
MTDLIPAVEQHCIRFNEAVRTGDWTPFVATFTEDASMVFTNVPAGPYSGRDQIAAAYREQPPDDTMAIESVEELDPQTARVRFAWDAGGDGTMVVRWRDGQVAHLEITFG